MPRPFAFRRPQIQRACGAPVGCNSQCLFQRFQGHRLRQAVIHPGLNTALFFFRQGIRRHADDRSGKVHLAQALGQNGSHPY